MANHTNKAGLGNVWGAYV